MNGTTVQSGLEGSGTDLLFLGFCRGKELEIKKKRWKNWGGGCSGNWHSW